MGAAAIGAPAIATGEGLLWNDAEAASDTVRSAQSSWAARPVVDRLRVLQAARHRVAARADEFARAFSPELARTEADSLVAEVLPLLAACQFLEQNAAKILRPRRLGRRGLPFWLSGVHSEVSRGPFGKVLVIGPANYPLFLPGVQALQALAAGNAVVWKPGRGGRAVAALFAQCLCDAGLPRQVLRITDESVEAAEREIAAGVDKVFFTGSAVTGRVLLKRLAETLTPCVAELSGCDAMVVLPSANLDVVVKALAFGMRLNGSSTCMAPRRVLLVDASTERRNDLLLALHEALRKIGPVTVADSVPRDLDVLLQEAQESGANVIGEVSAGSMRPVVVTRVAPAMKIAQADIFAPVLLLMDIHGEQEILAAQATCPFGLTASIFGAEREARRLAEKLNVGTVTINDAIASTADPRVPFGGRRQSGFGATRGAEGLLEMTAAKTVTARRGRGTRHYEATGAAHKDLFGGMILASHAATWRERMRGVVQLVRAGRRLTK